MKLLKWLSVADRFYKIYLDKQFAPRSEERRVGKEC